MKSASLTRHEKPSKGRIKYLREEADSFERFGRSRLRMAAIFRKEADLMEKRLLTCKKKTAKR